MMFLLCKSGRKFSSEYIAPVISNLHKELVSTHTDPDLPDFDKFQSIHIPIVIFSAKNQPFVYSNTVVFCNLFYFKRVKHDRKESANTSELFTHIIHIKIQGIAASTKECLMV